MNVIHIKFMLIVCWYISTRINDNKNLAKQANRFRQELLKKLKEIE